MVVISYKEDYEMDSSDFFRLSLHELGPNTNYYSFVLLDSPFAFAKSTNFISYKIQKWTICYLEQLLNFMEVWKLLRHR